jgi:hypothetical protein
MGRKLQAMQLERDQVNREVTWLEQDQNPSDQYRGKYRDRVMMNCTTRLGVAFSF